MGAFGLYTHIQANNLRSAILLTGFPLLLVGMVYAITLGMIGAGYLPSTGTVGGDLGLAASYLWAGAPLALAVSGVWFLIAWFGNTAIIDLATGARKVTREQEPELYNLLENLCISRGIPMPALGVIDSPALNAFASGVTRNQYRITVTRGLMETMDRDELEAVLGHELTHIQNRDVRTMIIAAVFAGVISLLAQVIFRAVQFGGAGRSKGGKGGGGFFVLIALGVAAIGYVLAIVIRMTLSRTREYVADAGAVELTRNPDAMIGALRKIEASTAGKLEAPEAVQAMFLENGRSGPMDLFATHPPIEKRIAALVKYAGGVDQPRPDAVETAAPAGPWS